MGGDMTLDQFHDVQHHWAFKRRLTRTDLQVLHLLHIPIFIRDVTSPYETTELFANCTALRLLNQAPTEFSGPMEGECAPMNNASLYASLCRGDSVALTCLFAPPGKRRPLMLHIEVTPGVFVEPAATSDGTEKEITVGIYTIQHWREVGDVTNGTMAGMPSLKELGVAPFRHSSDEGNGNDAPPHHASASLSGVSSAVAQVTPAPLAVYRLTMAGVNELLYENAAHARAFFEAADSSSKRSEGSSSGEIERSFAACFVSPEIPAQLIERGRKASNSPVSMLAQTRVVAKDANDDGLRWHEVSVMRSVHPINSEPILCVAFVDVTSRERAVGKLVAYKKRNKAASNLSEMKDEFLANTSHELRTPLNGIIGLGSALLDDSSEAKKEGESSGALTEEQTENVQLMVQSAKRLASLVNDILDFEKLKRGGLALHYGQIDIRLEVSRVFSLQQPLLAHKAVKLVNNVPEQQRLPLLHADTNRLQQILHNVIGNSVKFTEQGIISCNAYPDRRRKMMVIEVSDSGIGIPENALDRIFKSFEQVDGRAQRKAGGTGLGLAVTKKLVELHGGTIGVRSQLGVGSTVTIALPLSRKKDMNEEYDDAKEQGGETVADEDSAGMASSGVSGSDLDLGLATSDDHRPRWMPAQSTDVSGLDTSDTDGKYVDRQASRLPEAKSFATERKIPRILSVDDESVNQLVVEQMLKRQGFELLKAMDGLEALRTIKNDLREKRGLPDIVLLDVMMPNLSGFEVCQRLRKDFSSQELPIIMVSAKNSPEDIVEGLSYGANDYITKPFSRVEILARVQTQLKLRNAFNLQVEKQRSDALLSSMLPQSVIERLKAGEQPIADSYDGVTVIFSDIVGFTRLSSITPVDRIVHLLNDLFTEFDRLCDKHAVYKVETIGDAYMVVSGAPFKIPAPEQCRRSIAMAHDMIAAVKRLRHRWQDMPLQIRVGIHCGPAYAGVVGINRPRYCFMGDTVNTASRMESTSLPGSIQISENVKLQLDKFLTMGLEDSPPKSEAVEDADGAGDSSVNSGENEIEPSTTRQERKIDVQVHNRDLLKAREDVRRLVGQLEPHFPFVKGKGMCETFVLHVDDFIPTTLIETEDAEPETPREDGGDDRDDRDGGDERESPSGMPQRAQLNLLRQLEEARSRVTSTNLLAEERLHHIGGLETELKSVRENLAMQEDKTRKASKDLKFLLDEQAEGAKNLNELNAELLRLAAANRDLEVGLTETLQMASVEEERVAKELESLRAKLIEETTSRGRSNEDSHLKPIELPTFSSPIRVISREQAPTNTEILLSLHARLLNASRGPELPWLSLDELICDIVPEPDSGFADEVAEREFLAQRERIYSALSRAGFKDHNLHDLVEVKGDGLRSEFGLAVADSTAVLRTIDAFRPRKKHIQAGLRMVASALLRLARGEASPIYSSGVRSSFSPSRDVNNFRSSRQSQFFETERASEQLVGGVVPTQQPPMIRPTTPTFVSTSESNGASISNVSEVTVVRPAGHDSVTPVLLPSTPSAGVMAVPSASGASSASGISGASGASGASALSQRLAKLLASNQNTTNLFSEVREKSERAAGASEELRRNMQIASGSSWLDVLTPDQLEGGSVAEHDKIEKMESMYSSVKAANFPNCPEWTIKQYLAFKKKVRRQRAAAHAGSGKSGAHSTSSGSESPSSANEGSGGSSSESEGLGSDLEPVDGEDTRVVLLDVRSPVERAVSAIPDSIDVVQFDTLKADLSRDPRTVIVCQCIIGGRSGIFAEKLRKEGFAVRNLKFGLLGWAHHGLPLQDPADGTITRRIHGFRPPVAANAPTHYEVVLD